MLFNLPRSVSARVHQISYNIITFNALFRNLLFTFIARCQNSSCMLLKNLIYSSYFATSKFSIHYENTLCISLALIAVYLYLPCVIFCVLLLVLYRPLLGRK